MANTHTGGTTAEVLRLLGAAKLVRSKGVPTLDLRAAVRKGLPFSALESLSVQVDLPTQRLTAVLGIPSRTVARRKTAKALTPEESDRLYRVARAVAFAHEVLGGMPKARAWLTTPNRALGGETPLDLLDTDIGVRQVEEVLQRINYGLFS